MFSGIYKSKKVLITGDTGFKGSWLSAWLYMLGAEVYGLAKDIPSSPSMFECLDLASKIRHEFIDIRDFDKLNKVIRQIKPDFVFHLAAQTLVGPSYQDPLETFSSNIMGACHVAEALRLSAHPCTAVIISSDKAYENVEWTWGYRENDPLGGSDPYSASKGAMEIAIRSYYRSFFRQGPVRLGTARAGNVIGGGDWAEARIVPDCVRSWSQGQPVLIRSPKATRPWQHVLEPLSGYLLQGMALHTDPAFNGEAFNFGPFAEQNYTVLELLTTIADCWGLAADKRFEVQQQTSFHEAGLLKVNCDKALHLLGWRPCMRFEAAASMTAGWYAHYYQKGLEGLWELTIHQIEQYMEEAAAAGIAWARPLVH
ncbi:MAG: CDP-glucose 4,6-dehydratase [Bacteroidetes bacterium]|nr:MAG: CDP-glucose 4,6-dehydratase [Bacteroidota bacterium]